MKVVFKYILCCLFLLGVYILKANNKTVVLDNSVHQVNLSNQLSYYVDSTNELNLNNVASFNSFTESNSDFLNFKITSSNVWLKIQVLNKSNSNKFKLSIDDININEVALFELQDSSLIKVGNTFGSDFLLINKNERVPGIIFNIEIEPNKQTTYYIKIHNNGQLFVPIYIRTEKEQNEVWLSKFIVFGIYTGIFFALFFYNLFLALSIKDDRKTYFWYLLHTLFILLTQASFQGYTLMFLWPENNFMAKQSINLFTCLVSMSGIEYAKSFLLTKNNAYRLHKVLTLFHLLYIVVIGLSLYGQFNLAYTFLQPIQSTIALIMLYTSMRLVFKGSRLAFFYFISWSVLFVSIIIFVLTNIGILPYNLFTSQIMLYGSALQVILLSIAQADKYNLLKIEEQKAQLQAIKVSKLNEEITKEQNVRLEQKVKERTNELTESNKQLSETLTVLKDTQIQLVEKEKMSSLGQLTAGIAHEINNPINFVSGNIKPLKRDVVMIIDLVNQIEQIAKLDETVEQKTKRINSLKQDLDFDYLNEEIEFLLKGIEEGANRTTEIVKGLKVFSRSDEFETKFADIHEGINSTLVLLNNQLNSKIKVDKIFKAENGVIEHFPGKMNQVFMNLLSNSIYAVNKQWNNEVGGVITIRTEIVNGKFVITFSDNGIGMTPDVVSKMFDPFFTTKEVGEGTGLGMSIVYKTIEMHKGKISVESALGKGTTFTIEIPNQLAI